MYGESKYVRALTSESYFFLWQEMARREMALAVAKEVCVCVLGGLGGLCVSACLCVVCLSVCLCVCAQEARGLSPGPGLLSLLLSLSLSLSLLRARARPP